MPRSVEIPQDRPADEVPEYVRAAEYARDAVKKGDFEFAYTMLYFIRNRTPEHLQAPAKELVTDMLADISRSDYQAYPSLRDDPRVRGKYVTRDRDASLQYKFDLTRQLELPEETNNAIAVSAADRVLASLQTTVDGGPERRDSFSSSRNRPDYEDHVRRVCEIMYQFPPQDLALIKPLQERYRALAPRLLLNSTEFSGTYLLQELGIALRLPWHTELCEVHGPRAMDLLFTEYDAQPDYAKGRSIDTVTRLQNYCNAPVTDERRAGAVAMLRHAINYTGDTPTKLIAAFGIDEKTVRDVAREAASDYVQRHEHVEPQHRSAWAPEEMVRKYGVRPQDLPLVEREREACVRDVSTPRTPQERTAAAVEFVRKAEQNHTAYLLPLTLAAEVHRSLDEPQSATIHHLLHAFSAPPEVKAYRTKALRLLFADRAPQQLPVMDLGGDHARYLWSQLAEDPECAPAADHALDRFLSQYGLNPERMRQLWGLSSNNRKEYADTMGTRIVQAQNIQAISELEHRSPGAARYFYDRWNIGMFSRYPAHVLGPIRAAEEADRRETGKPRSKPKKTLLVLFPAADWNGAFHGHELINQLSEECSAKGFHMHIAEAGSRISAMRAFARVARQHGPIDVCVLGGHANKDSLTLGPDDLGKIKTDHFAFSDTEAGQTVPNEQLQRLRSYCSPNCRIIFKACSVGQSGGLAQAVSRAMNVTSVGAECPTGLKAVDLATGNPQYRDAGVAREYQQPRPPPSGFLGRLWRALRRKKK
ncbi:MAG TPA: hypothetical protein PKV72_03000 [Candidatus Peribacteria bacterium]|nr:hypothetical protein [Candidatus Peribacteria bacterium]